MPEPRRLPRLLAALLLVVFGAGCSSIPDSGPVRVGQAASPEADSGYRVQPLGPQNGESPVDVVRGFYLAGIGVDDDFAAARQFLTPARREAWRPTARTVVHPLGALTVTLATTSTLTGPAVPGTGAGAAAVRASVTVHADDTGEVDATGHYTATAPGTALDVVLHLTREGGQWRIADAPDLLLLDDPDFSRVFLAAPVYFADRTDGQLVGEQRWVLDRSSTATTLVADLLAGPSPALAPAVTTGAPVPSTLGAGSVVITGSSATVDLPQRLGDAPAASVRLLTQQLTATLQALPQVATVRVTVAGGDLPAAGAPRLAGAPSGDVDAPGPPQDTAGEPVVVAGGVLARLAGSALTPVPVSPPLAGVTSPAVSGNQVAALTSGGTQLVRVVSGQATPVLSGAALTAPSFDRHGWLWSTSAACAGAVTAVSRSAAPVQVAAGALAGRTLLALRVSPDGARALVASTGPDGAHVDLAAVRRTADGTPTRLDAVTSLTPWLGQVRAVAWVGQDTLAVLGSARPGSAQAQDAGSAPVVWLVTGGRPQSLGAPTAPTPPATPAAAPPDPVSVAGGTGPRTLLVGTSDGRLWQLAGVDWASLGVAAVDPAYPG